MLLSHARHALVADYERPAHAAAVAADVRRVVLEGGGGRWVGLGGEKRVTAGWARVWAALMRESWEPLDAGTRQCCSFALCIVRIHMRMHTYTHAQPQGHPAARAPHLQVHVHELAEPPAPPQVPQRAHELLRPPVDAQDGAVEEHERGAGRVDLGAVQHRGRLHAQVVGQLRAGVGVGAREVKRNILRVEW